LMSGFAWDFKVPLRLHMPRVDGLAANSAH